MFRDVSLSEEGLRTHRHASAGADLATILPYSFLVAAAIAIGVHLVLSALHAPFRLLPMPEPSPAALGLTSSIVIAASVAGLLAAMAGLGLGALKHARARVRRAGLDDPMSDFVQPETVVATIEAAARPGFVVLFQVAHFPFLSVRHGADAANAILRMATEELSRMFHAPHHVGRLAAGEFVVTVDGPNADDCILLVEEVRRSVSSRPVSADSGELRVTLLAGMARISPNVQAADSLESARRAIEHARNAASDSVVYAFDKHAKPVY